MRGDSRRPSRTCHRVTVCSPGLLSLFLFFAFVVLSLRLCIFYFPQYAEVNARDRDSGEGAPRRPPFRPLSPTRAPPRLPGSSHRPVNLMCSLIVVSIPDPVLPVFLSQRLAKALHVLSPPIFLRFAGTVWKEEQGKEKTESHTEGETHNGKTRQSCCPPVHF